MKRCPSCEGTRHYQLSDGRLKCRPCGVLFTWTSVWDAVRLPTTTKQRLLDLLVLGVPSPPIDSGSAAQRARLPGSESPSVS